MSQTAQKRAWGWKDVVTKQSYPQDTVDRPFGAPANSPILAQGYGYIRLLFNVLNVLALAIIWYLVVDGIIGGGGTNYNAVVAAIANPLSMHSYIMNPIIMFMFLFIFLNAGIVLLLKFGWGLSLGNSHFSNSWMPGVRYGLFWGSMIALSYQQVWSAFGLQVGALLAGLWSYWRFPVTHAFNHISKPSGESVMAWYAPLHLVSVIEYIPDKLELVSSIIYSGLNVCGLFIGAFVITSGGWPLNISVDNLSITLLVIFAVLGWLLNGGYCSDTFFLMLFGFDFLMLSSFQKYDPTVGIAVYATTGAIGGFTLLVSMLVGYLSMRRVRSVMEKHTISVFPM